MRWILPVLAIVASGASYADGSTRCISLLDAKMQELVGSQAKNFRHTVTSSSHRDGDTQYEATVVTMQYTIGDRPFAASCNAHANGPHNAAIQTPGWNYMWIRGSGAWEKKPEPE